jgi:cytochrome c-type biogenesis protein CcmH/NrfF
MSVLLWWVPAVVVVAVAWWRLRPSRRAVRDKDLRALQRILRGDG